jgi:prepilin-type N-terminal cleavage/methylation domain-containing protein
MCNESMNRKYQRGFSLGELGLVLLIVAIISMFAYPKFIEYSETVVATEEADNITQYVSKTKAAHSADSDFQLVSTAVLRTTGIFPASMVQGTNVVNKYQGTVSVEPTTLTNSNDSALFTSTNYSLAGCREVVPRMAAVARTVSVNGSVVKPGNEPLNRELLGNACTVAANTLTFAVSK